MNHEVNNSETHSANKHDSLQQHRLHATDTGSTQVQIAQLTERINQLNTHLATHRHDSASRVGLMKLVGQRRRFLKYLGRTNKAAYTALIERLGIRG